MCSDELIVAGKYWSEKKPDLLNSKWWGNPTILRHINRIVCGEEIDGPFAGTETLIQRHAGRISHGISVGCGGGGKEMSLMSKGIVDTFTLVELSETRLDSARARAEKMGMDGRLKFVLGDPFRLAIGEKFDLVYWNNALHHMNDADEAVRWSKSVLYPGGWFVMDDYVGPTRWQWPDQQIIIGERVLSLLPERLLRDPRNPDKLLPRTIARPNLRKS